MTLLLLGLVLFLGVHSSRIVAAGWRDTRIAAWGMGRWKGVYSLASLAGLVLIVFGYAAARREALPLWPQPGDWTRWLAAALMLMSFVLVVAGNMPRNAFKARLRHPMLLGVKVWALAHLLVNNTAADLLLFGAFLAWAVAAFASSRRRDRVAGTPPPATSTAGTVQAIVIGGVAWLVFLLWAHAWLFGARPFPTLG